MPPRRTAWGSPPAMRTRLERSGRQRSYARRRRNSWPDCSRSGRKRSPRNPQHLHRPAARCRPFHRPGRICRSCSVLSSRSNSRVACRLRNAWHRKALPGSRARMTLLLLTSRSGTPADMRRPDTHRRAASRSGATRKRTAVGSRRCTQPFHSMRHRDNLPHHRSTWSVHFRRRHRRQGLPGASRSGCRPRRNPRNTPPSPRRRRRRRI